MKKRPAHILLFAALTINDTTFFEFVEKNNFAIQQNLNLVKAQEVNLLIAKDAPYNWTLDGDISSTRDKTESLTTFTQSDIRQHSGNIEFTKGWEMGLSSTLKYSHIQSNQYNGYGINLWTVGLEKEIYPSLKNNSNKSSVKSAELTFQASLIENELARRKIVRSQLDLYGKLQLMQIQIKENQTLMKEYEKIVKSVQRKKQNNFATAGELEQATAEMKARELNLKQLQMIYKSTLELFLSDNNLNNLTDVTIAEPDFDLPSKIDKIILSEQFPAEQRQIKSLKNIKAKDYNIEAVRFDLESSQDDDKPTISLFATHTAQGLEHTLAESFKESQESSTNKYVFGIKLTHEFGNNQVAQLNAFKKSQLNLYQREKENLENRMLQHIELARMDLQLALDALTSQTEIVNLRRQVIEQVTQNYNQGRIDISLLFDAYNKAVQSEISRTEALNNLRLKKYDFETILLKE